MSKDKYYAKLLNAKRWKDLRKKVLEMQPLCVDCKSKGIITAASQVHHCLPIEDAVLRRNMEHRAYDVANLVALCSACHAARHAAMKSHSKVSVQANAKRKSESFFNRYLQEEGGGVFSSAHNPCKPTRTKEK